MHELCAYLILDYAHRQGLRVDTFVEAWVSSRRAAVKRGLHTVLEQLHPDDLILVSELSRLGRSVGQIIQLVDRLIKQRVRSRSHQGAHPAQRHPGPPD